MTRTLHNRLDISDDLTLPLDVTTGTEAILATKGMGKTHLAQVIAEELLDHAQVFIAIDPTDAWWGLRSSADGKHDGYPVTIFGGSHGDMKLDPNAGVQIADLVIAGHSVVVCTRGLDDAQEVAIVAAIMKRLYRKNREPRKIFLDEADMFAPERMDTKGQAESLSAVRNIVKRGRNSGLGITLITQRSASINKDVLNLCDTLFVLGMESPLDIDPIDRWIRTKDKKKAELATELVQSLPVLPRGDAWAWNSRANVHKRFRARPKRTFDSGGTPKVGQHKRVAKRLAPVDLEKLGDEIQRAVAEQRADDPAWLRNEATQLRLQIKGLEAKLNLKTQQYERASKDASTAQLAAAKPTKMVDPKKLEKITARAETVSTVFAREMELARERFEKACEAASKVFAAFNAAISQLRGELKQPTVVFSTTVRNAKFDSIEATLTGPRLSAGKSTKPTQTSVIPIKLPPTKEAASTGDGNEKPTPAHLRLLTGIAWWESVGVPQPDLMGVAFIARTSTKSSSFDNNRSWLRARGYIDYPSPGHVNLTAKGRAIAPPPSVEPTNAAIQAAVMGMITPALRRMVGTLVKFYPNEISLEDFAKESGTSTTSSSFDNNRSFLRARGLAVYPRAGFVRASALLFPEA